jgi:hypothetical protein
MGLNLSGSTHGPVSGSCEHVYEPSGFINGGEFLDWLSDYWLLKKDVTLLACFFAITDMATVRKSEVMPETFNVAVNCTTGNYTEKWIVILRTY